MWFLVAGILLLGLYVADVPPVSHWHWAIVLAPFALAAAWWAFVDKSGITQRREMKKLEERKVARRERDMEALGLTTRRGRKPGTRPPKS